MPLGREVGSVGHVDQVAAIEGRGIVAFVHEEAGREVAPEAAQAVEVDLLPPRDFLEAFPELVEGDVLEAFDMAGSVFILRPNVEEGDRSVAGEGIDLVVMEGLEKAVLEVLGNEAEHVDRVLGRPEGRSIGEIEFLQLACLHSGLHGRRDDVDPLVDPRGAEGLGPEDPLTSFFVDELQDHGAGPRVIGRVVGRGQKDAPGLDAPAEGVFLPDPDHPDGQGEDLEDRGAEGPAVDGVPPGDVVGHDPSFLVGRAGQGDHLPFPGHLI